MGQLTDISDDTISADILTYSKGYFRLAVGKLPGTNHRVDADGRHHLVGHLNSYHRDLIRNRRNAHTGSTQRQRDIVCQIGQFV